MEEQPFDCPVWTHTRTRLTLNGNQLAAAANAYSTPCDGTAVATGAGTIAELEAAHLEGRIAILYGDLMPGPLSPKSWFLKSEREDKLIRLLEEKQPLAVLTVQQHRGGLERLIEDWEFRIPSATITPQSALVKNTCPSAITNDEYLRRGGEDGRPAGTSRTLSWPMKNICPMLTA